MYHAFRLKINQDLRKGIEDYVINNNIKAGVVLSCVGSLKQIKIRLADGEKIIVKEELFEIVSITGTLSIDDVHLHISISDINGKTIGGHLKEGCIINTTAEIILLELDNVIFNRELDEKTGYKELVIK